MRQLRSLWVVFATLMSFGAGTGLAEVVLNTQVGEEIRYLDPQKATGISSAHININMFVGLYEYHPETAAPHAQLVKSYSHNDDYTQYTFDLRDDVFWVSRQNGKVEKHRALTAHDVVYSFQRMISPELASEYAYMLYILRNGEKINTGKIKDLGKLGVEALSDYKLRLTLEGPVPTLIQYLPHHSFHVVPKEPIEKYGDKWIEQDKIWTSGPFAFKEWLLKQRITLVKNPHYPGADQVQADTVHFHFIGTYSAESVRAFRAGKIDIDFQSPPANELRAMKKAGHLLYAEQLGSYFLRLNTTVKPLDNPLVRKALALAIPREEITRFVMKAGQKPLYSLIPGSLSGYEPQTFTDPETKYDAQIKEARKLLANAGFAGGKGFPKLNYVYNTSETHKKVAVVIAKAWKKNLGIEIKPLNEEWRVYLANQSNLNYQIQRAGWVADMEDPMNFAEMFTTTSGNNNTGFSHPEYDKLISKARVEGDLVKRSKLISQAEDILMDELPVIPLFSYVSINLKQPYISGFYANKLDQHPLAGVKIDILARQKKYSQR